MFNLLTNYLKPYCDLLERTERFRNQYMYPSEGEVVLTCFIPKNITLQFGSVKLHTWACAPALGRDCDDVTQDRAGTATSGVATWHQ
jgi:hypothetical protein